MKTYARKINSVAVDVTTTDDLESMFHGDLLAEFIEVPASTVNGSVFKSGKWTAPPAEPAPLLPKLTPMTFYLAFTPAERIAIKTSTDEAVKEFWDTYQRAERTDTMVDPNLSSVRDGLLYLTGGPGILASPDRVAEILAGTPK